MGALLCLDCISDFELCTVLYYVNMQQEPALNPAHVKLDTFPNNFVFCFPYSSRRMLITCSWTQTTQHGAAAPSLFVQTADDAAVSLEGCPKHGKLAAEGVFSTLAHSSIRRLPLFHAKTLSFTVRCRSAAAHFLVLVVAAAEEVQP